MGAKAETDFHEPDKGIKACMVACFEACKAVCSDVDLDDRTEDIAVAEIVTVRVQDICPGSSPLIRGKWFLIGKCCEQIVKIGLHFIGADLKIDLFLRRYIFIEVCPRPGQLSGNGGEGDLLVGDRAEELVCRGFDLGHSGLFLFFTSRSHEICHGIHLLKV